MERILIPLDGSSFAERALAQGHRIARPGHSEILLVRAVHVPLSLAKIDTAHLEKQEKKEAEAYLSEVSARLNSAGIAARWAVIDGPPAEAILETAKREKASLIAMTTHGRSGVSRWALGSVAGKVLQASHVPVLMMHSFRASGSGATHAGGGEIPFRRILLPLDGSATAAGVLPAVGALGALCDSEILVLQVVPGGEQGAGTPVPEIPVEESLNQLRASGRRARLLCVKGEDPAASILDVAEGEVVDLIAMSTHGRSGISRWVFGSVAERVIQSSAIPLLVVRAALPPFAHS